MKSEKNSVEVYLSKWREGSDTYVTMRGALDRVARALGAKDALSFAWHELDHADTRSLGAKLLAEDLEAVTVNKLLAAVRGILETAHDLELLSDDQYKRIKIKNEKGTSENVGRRLAVEELNAIEKGIIDLPAMEAAIIAILAGAGLRRVEVLRIEKRHYDKERGRLLAIGKGKKKRSVPVGNRWRSMFEKWWLSCEEGRLVFPVTRRQISYMVKKLCTTIGIKCTPHDFRRTFATHVIEKTDIIVAQKLLGHSDVKTTMLYDKRGEAAEEEAVKDL